MMKRSVHIFDEPSVMNKISRYIFGWNYRLIYRLVLTWFLYYFLPKKIQLLPLRNVQKELNIHLNQVNRALFHSDKFAALVDFFSVLDRIDLDVFSRATERFDLYNHNGVYDSVVDQIKSLHYLIAECGRECIEHRPPIGEKPTEQNVQVGGYGNMSCFISEVRSCHGTEYYQKKIADTEKILNQYQIIPTKMMEIICR